MFKRYTVKFFIGLFGALFFSTYCKASQTKQLVPPPPPSQPSYLLGPTDGSLDFINSQPFLFNHVDLQKRLSDAKVQLNEKSEDWKEKKEKAERFEPLYQEGVISRHELEAVQKEAKEAEKELDKYKANVLFLKEQDKTLLPKSRSNKTTKTAKNKSTMH